MSGSVWTDVSTSATGTKYTPVSTSAPKTTTATATSLLSSTVASVKDTLSMAQLQKQFGIAAAVISADPSLSAALNKILGTGGGSMITDTALQEQIIKNTDWYRKQTDTQRTFDYAKATNPGQFAADLQANASAIVRQYTAMGVPITAAEAMTYAEQMMKQSAIVDGKTVTYDQNWLNQAMSDAIKFDTTNDINGRVVYTGLTGKLETIAQTLYKTAYDYGFPQTVSNDRFQGWFESNLRGLVAGTVNANDIDNELVTRAKSFAPGMAAYLDRGQTLRDAANPWLQAIADTWDMDVNSIDLNNDYVQRALNYQDEKTKEIAPMNLYDTKKMARRSANFDATQKAKEEKTAMASLILKDFGFLG